MNNADLTVQSLRDLQAIALDRMTSPDHMVKKIDFVIQRANDASKQINRAEEQVNNIINVLSSKGLFNGDIVAAFTGLDKHKSEELAKNLSKAKKEILK